MDGLQYLDVLLSNSVAKINGDIKAIVGLARYATIKNPSEEYVKIAFSDGSGMYFPLAGDDLFVFKEKLHTAENILDEQIGKEQIIDWQNMRFTLVNGNDYQYVKQFYIGTLEDLEGEVRFSDYENEEGNVLSLGWNMYTGKREDVYALHQKIEIE